MTSLCGKVALLVVQASGFEREEQCKEKERRCLRLTFDCLLVPMLPAMQLTGGNVSDYMQLPLEPQKALYCLKLPVKLSKSMNPFISFN